MELPVVVNTTVLSWALAAFIVSLVLCVLNVRLFHWLVSQTKKLKTQAGVTKKQIELGYNKIASMSVQELDEYLTRIMSMIIQITVVTDIAENDPDAAGILYGNLAVKMENYLGPETVEALDYFYGKNYLTRWVEMSYGFLDSGGGLNDIVRKAKANAMAKSDETEETPG